MPINVNEDTIGGINQVFTPLSYGPLDARLQVSAYTDLFSSSTWSVKGDEYAYPGMLVVVQGDPDPSKDGLYRLKSNEDWEHSAAEHWEKIATKAEVAERYLKPSTGIPVTDLATAVRNSLTKADNAAPQSSTYTKTEINAKLDSYQEITDFVSDVTIGGLSIVNNGIAEIPESIGSGGSANLVEYDLTSQIDGTTKIFALPSNITKEPLYVFYSGIKLTSGTDYVVDLTAKTLTTLFTKAPDSDYDRHLVVTLS